MSQKRILIVDDEESILAVLKNSLKKLGPDYQVVTVTDGFAALDKLLEKPFDVVVTDFNMAQMDGLELMEAIRFAQPNARLIMITAHGNETIETEAKRLQAFKYLTKPIKISAFREVIAEAFAHYQAEEAKNTRLLVFSNERYQQISVLIDQLRSDVGASCIFLTDTSGQLVAQNGATGEISIENIASLLGGGMATIIEAGRAMESATTAINLIYHEGPNEYLYAVNVGNHMLLIIVINRSPYSSRLGSVWYHARQAALTLNEQLEQPEQAAPDPIFSGSMNDAFEQELNKLFSDDNIF
jgi:CheY-like chemotaxis protein/predicted regulator of Ras-like GTPase activity (Roadblock/LC7/MglB family)